MGFCIGWELPKESIQITRIRVHLSKIKVTASTQMFEGLFDNLVDWSKVERSNYLKSMDSAWVQIQIMDFKIMPNYYSLRHDKNPTNFLRHWKLEGSVDGNTWIVLKSHSNDTTLSSSLCAASWAISTTQYFNYFRITMTGPCSTNARYLLMNGFELYGSIHPTK